MAVNLTGFVIPEQSFDGLNQASQTLERRNIKDAQFRQQGEARKAANSRFLTDYLDQKQFLTGTNYDPMIVKELNETLQEGAALALKGADTPTLMMALGPRVQKLNEYSTKAKLIDKQVKDSATKLGKYKGYNIETLTDLAKKTAFYGPDGKLKDISSVDPNEDFITETVKMFPEQVTTGAGLDDFVNRTPMSDVSRETQTMYAGKKRNVKYDAKLPFWMDLALDEKGQTAQDLSGNPIGLDVVSDVLVGDDKKPMINPETGKPYRVMEQGRFNAVMQHNPDIADYVRGQVNRHFKELGAEKSPSPGSPAYEMMARAIAYDEFKTRDRSSFKTIDRETKSTPVTRIELGYPAYEPRSSGSGKGFTPEPTIRDVYDEVNDQLDGVRSMAGSKIIPMSSLSASAQAILIKYANDLTKDDLVQEDLAVMKTPDGKINLTRLDSKKIIAPLGFQDVNLPAQPSVKEKRKVIADTPKSGAPSKTNSSGIKWK